MFAYLSRRWLIFEQFPIARRQISELILGYILDIVNFGAEQFIFEQARVGETIASWFTTIALFLVLCWVLIGLGERGEVRIPVVVASVEGIFQLNWILALKFINKFSPARNEAIWRRRRLSGWEEFTHHWTAMLQQTFLVFGTEHVTRLH